MIPWRDRRGEETGIAEYDGNPFIRCLPPPPSEQDCFHHLVSKPACTPAERLLAPHLREQLAFVRVRQSFFPTGVQLRQAKQIDLLIRAGYVARNPSRALYQAQMTDLAGGSKNPLENSEVRRQLGSDMAADSMAALGPSGIGKTTVLRRMLDGYPQVICHNGPEIGTVTQIVWLRVEAAADGSSKQTILSMFAEIDRLLGTNYSETFGRLTRERLLVKAQQVCARHAIGLIAVDEIQNLANSRHSDSDLMSFLTSLVNVINVPILMIGTMKALPMMTSCFRTARRGEGNGSIIYEPMALNQEWRTFIGILFEYQWLTTPTELSDEIVETLWEESQGIIDIAIKLFVLSQMRAIRLGEKGRPEVISKGLIETVAKESLRLVRPMIDALRRRDWRALNKYDDLGGLDTFIAAELQREWPGAAIAPDLDALATSLKHSIDGLDGEVANGLLTAALAANGIQATEMEAIMKMVADTRSSTNPIGAVADIRLPARGRKRPSRTPVPPTDVKDIRGLKAGTDPLAGFAEAGLLDVA